MSLRKRQALAILTQIGMPREQLNDRSALTLLALLALTPKQKWSGSQSPLIGVTPIMDWVRENYSAQYAPNTRETFRRQTLHQFVDAKLAVYNPDNPNRPVNSPAAVYQISQEALQLCRTFGSDRWEGNLAAYLDKNPPLSVKYSAPRNRTGQTLNIPGGLTIQLSPGIHSNLIQGIATTFRDYFAPSGKLLYAGDTGNKIGFFDDAGFEQLGLKLDKKGKLPDVVIFDTSRNWLLLIEAVTSHGPIDAKRKGELTRLFEKSSCGIVYVTAFPDKKVFNKYLSQIAWESEVWIADNPGHMIHFNGERFLGPYD